MKKHYVKVIMVIAVALTVVRGIQYGVVSHELQSVMGETVTTQEEFNNLTNQREALQASINDYQQKFENAEKEFNTNTSNINECNSQIESMNQEISTLSNTIAEIDLEMIELEEKSVELQSKIEKLKQ